MKKYILYGIPVLFLGIFAYHFIAANQAEKDIREAILETNSRHDIFFSISTSSLRVHPFSGDLEAGEFNAINRNYIIRIGSAILDLSYGDFLNIYFNGPEYGLKHTDHGRLNLQSFGLIWRISFFEVNADTLTISPLNSFTNLLKAASGVALQASDSPSYLLVEGKKFTFSHPDSIHGFLNAKSVQFKKWIQNDNKRTAQNPDSLVLNDVLWTLPQTLQEKYNFFVRGFDFKSGRVPIESIQLVYTSSYGGRHLQIEKCIINSEIFTAIIDGEIFANFDMMELSEIKRLEIRITDFSEKFSTFLENLETLLNIKIPREGDDIRFSLSGSLLNPSITGK